MKAQFASLLLLVPTACGLQYYKCESGKKFDYSVVRGYTSEASYDQIQASDPLFVGGSTFGAYRFTANRPDGTPTNYLVQSVSVDPYQRIFELSGSRWRICTLLDFVM
ncbi:BgTH12-07798 [Blumeria graminis f. sp. triticale]|uniref:Bgt-50847 n=2 Tax=Blumeria graminis TaxID=34373 RepID=A0A9X9MQ44_BLUGR|nr:BgTH12-07798 [Blumeria graminis f. sp. triticale]VDB96429.1 Bgt-50847 [Blumeria graminis f. sp. tritici]